MASRILNAPKPPAAPSHKLSEAMLAGDYYAHVLNRFYDPAFGTLPGSFGWPTDRYNDRTHAPLPNLTEEDWRVQLVLARDLVSRIHLAIGFRNHIRAFIGSVSVQFVKRGGAPGAAVAGPVDADSDGITDADPDAQLAQEVWDEWCEENDWGMGECDREKECLSRKMTEGEATLEFFRGQAGRVPLVRHIEPELIRAPVQLPREFDWAVEEDWRWGILTRPNDAERPLALWVAEPEGEGGRVVAADRFVRTKANVDRSVKRGLSDFFPTAELLRKTAGLLDNMAHVARLQAAIAWWEEFTTATQAQVLRMAEEMRQPIPAGVPVGAAGARQPPAAFFPPLAQEYYPAGSIPRTDGGRSVKPGPVSQPGGFVEVERVVMRSVSFRYGLPGSFTGETDTFAGALVSGSPFVRCIEEEQSRQQGFVQAIIARVLRLSEESGRLPAGTSQRVKPILTSPPVVIADEEKQARVNVMLLEKGLADPYEIIKARGEDPKVVLANLAAFKQKMGQMGQSSMGPMGSAPMGAFGVPQVGQDDPNATPPGSAGGDGSSPNAMFGESWLSESGPPGPPPRPGLVWNDSTHRWRHPQTGEEHEHVTGQPKTKAKRKELATNLQKAWMSVRNDMAKAHGTSQINDKMTPEQQSLEGQLTGILRVIATGHEFNGPHDLGPVSDQRYAGYYRGAVETIGKLRASVAAKSEGVSESRQEGEVWQGQSGHWFTLKNGHVQPAAAPSAKQGGESQGGFSNKADLHGMTDEELAAHLDSLTQDKNAAYQAKDHDRFFAIQAVWDAANDEMHRRERKAAAKPKKKKQQVEPERVPLSVQMHQNPEQFRRDDMMAELYAWQRRNPGSNNHKLHAAAQLASHRAAVETALNLGKKVPPEVLADYPDLAAKHKSAEKPARDHKSTVQAIADSTADPVAKDYIESALFNHDGTPADLARQLGSFLETHSVSGGSLKVRNVPPQVRPAVEQALLAIGATRHGPEPGEQTEHSGHYHQPSEGLVPGDPVTVVHQPIVFGDQVVSKGLTRARKTESIGEEISSPPFPGAVFDRSKHRWVKGTQSAKNGQQTSPADVHPDDRAAIEKGIADAAARAPAKEPIPSGVVAKVKDFALSALAKAAIWVTRLTPAAQRVGRLLAEVLDTPEDMKKFGYNPTTAGGHDVKGVDPIKSATTDALGVGVGGHLAITVASQILSRLIVGLQRRVRGEAIEGSEGDGVREWAEMLAGLFAHVNETFGLGGHPDADSVEKAIRSLLADKF